MSSVKKTARLAGLLYLLSIVFTVIADKVLLSRLIVDGNAATTARNIAASAAQFRFGIVVDVVAAMFFFLAAWALYALLKPVNKNLALLFLLLNLGGVTLQCLNDLNFFAALQLSTGADYLQVFQADQLQALAMLFIGLRDIAYWIGQIFYAVWLLPLGYLVFKSGFLPKILGIVMMVHFCFWLLTFFQKLLLPSFDAITYVSYPLGFLSEAGLTFWLLIMGVKEQKPATAEVG